jgi:hypothetical protein
MVSTNLSFRFPNRLTVAEIGAVEFFCFPDFVDVVAMAIKIQWRYRSVRKVKSAEIVPTAYSSLIIKMLDFGEK